MTTRTAENVDSETIHAMATNSFPALARTTDKVFTACHRGFRCRPSGRVGLGDVRLVHGLHPQPNFGSAETTPRERLRSGQLNRIHQTWEAAVLITAAAPTDTPQADVALAQKATVHFRTPP